MGTLDIVPIHFADSRDHLHRLVALLERVFDREIRVRIPWFDPETPYDSSRGQYNSTVFLKLLLGDSGDDAWRVLGVTSVDLFIPVLTYVFGEAQVNGRAAVVSSHRLRPEAYGLPVDRERLGDRLDKEAVHELGHTLGLLHCADHECVMTSSTYVEEIDLKQVEFCPSCLRAVRGVPGKSRA